MPTPTAIVFRPGRRSHRGRPGRRGNLSRFRVGFAGAQLDISGHGVVLRVPGFCCPAYPYEARLSRLSARFSLGDIVFDAGFRDWRHGIRVDARARLWFVGCGHVGGVITAVDVGPLRIVHGDALYHFGPGSTLSRSGCLHQLSHAGMFAC